PVRAGHRPGGGRRSGPGHLLVRPAGGRRRGQRGGAGDKAPRPWPALCTVRPGPVVRGRAVHRRGRPGRAGDPVDRQLTEGGALGVEWFDDSALTLATFLPLLGAVAVAVLPRERDGLVRGAALTFSGLALLVGVGMLARFDYGAGAAMQFEVSRSWIPSIGAGYHVGVDGIALPLLVLSLLLSLLCVVYSWRLFPDPRNPKAFPALLVLLETGMNGTFAALDLVLFFVFWETVLIPMYFLIAVWGGPR